jgi:4-oxalocrotonate tautomerase
MNGEEEETMPHVIVKMYPGRSEEQKKHLTAEIVRDVVEIIKCPEEAVSVAIEEVEKAAWPEKVYRPDIMEKQQTLYRKPGYKNPFE